MGRPAVRSLGRQINPFAGYGGSHSGGVALYADSYVINGLLCTASKGGDKPVKAAAPAKPKTAEGARRTGGGGGGGYGAEGDDADNSPTRGGGEGRGRG